MTGTERRDKILEKIKCSEIPISGSSLAKAYDVSRQVIVQDIALIRAAGYDILSTHRGYVLNAPHTVSRTFKVRHTDERMEEELCSIVDLGGCVVDVMVNHRVYGQMKARLGIRSRRNVTEFLQDIQSGKSSPLKNITSDYHYHMIEADNEKTLDMVEQLLREKGFLIEG
ncbi:MAG: transcription repressor NadR [Ruminococcus sp.]|nr:transcription repressor NadR [Ruminococcus sp.]